MGFYLGENNRAKTFGSDAVKLAAFGRVHTRDRWWSGNDAALDQGVLKSEQVVSSSCQGHFDADALGSLSRFGAGWISGFPCGLASGRGLVDAVPPLSCWLPLVIGVPPFCEI